MLRFALEEMNHLIASEHDRFLMLAFRPGVVGASDRTQHRDTEITELPATLLRHPGEGRDPYVAAPARRIARSTQTWLCQMLDPMALPEALHDNKYAIWRRGKHA